MHSFLKPLDIDTDMIAAHRSVASKNMQVLTLATDVQLYLDDDDALAIVRALATGLGLTVIAPRQGAELGTEATGQVTTAQVTR